ncbi:MAG: SufD family Fe-S cluster assembly protein, partial [Fimbriimonadales bacterium]|nr:SufD family Fe-S cluster assembly protein [Fimbriimonadales bacterium]
MRMTTEVLKDVPQGLTRARLEQRARALGEPEWHIQRRIEAYDRFVNLPIPSPKQEDWRYTDITSLHLEEYPAVAWSEVPLGETPKQMPEFLTESPVVRVYHRAGFGFEADVPDALREQGVQVRDLHEVLRQNPELLKRDLGRLAPIPGDKFTELHTAAWDSGLYVYIPREAHIEGVIEIIHWFETPGLHFPHTVIVCESGSAANIVQSFFSPEGAKVFVLGAIEVFNAPNSALRHTLMQRMGRESIFISSVDYEQRRDSRVLSLNVG